MINQKPDPIDATIDAMLQPGRQALDQLGGALAGVSTEASAAFAEFSKMAEGLHTTGQRAAARVRQLEAANELPLEHRRDLARTTRSDADTILRKLNVGAQAQVPSIERALSDAMLPRPHADPGQRILVRDELRERLRNLRGNELHAEVIKHLGDPRRDGELLSSFGEAMFVGAGASDQYKALRAAAVQKYATPPPGASERMRAAARAFEIYQKANLPGIVAGHHQAGRMHLDRDLPLPPRAMP